LQENEALGWFLKKLLQKQRRVARLGVGVNNEIRFCFANLRQDRPPVTHFAKRHDLVDSYFPTVGSEDFLHPLGNGLGVGVIGRDDRDSLVSDIGFACCGQFLDKWQKIG